MPPFLFALLVAAFAAGCDTPPPPRAPVAQADTPEITRDVALKVARYDAAVRFQGFSASFVDAQPLGRFWVVELHGADGQGLRYAISKTDGAIKQRTMVR